MILFLLEDNKLPKELELLQIQLQLEEEDIGLDLNQPYHLDLQKYLLEVFRLIAVLVPKILLSL
jgi:hypothetical protein